MIMKMFFKFSGLFLKALELFECRRGNLYIQLTEVEFDNSFIGTSEKLSLSLSDLKSHFEGKLDHITSRKICVSNKLGLF